ncbi:MAG: class IV adenylate cyclase [Anaerolineae bacterium]|nr:class IV adenylate cyclase [Anaerolineae bacterium]
MSGEGNTETEAKLWVDDLSAVEMTLQTLGAVLAAPRVFERNVRYDLPNGSLGKRGVVLRLRQDSRVRLTYKEGASAEDGVISRYEAEVEVSDFKTMDTILGLLGYVHDVAYEKYRTTYTLDGCEVVLDELPFGRFVEVEGEHAEILAVIERLGLSDALRVQMSYVRAFDVIRRRLELPFKDATFEHFSRIGLPPTVKNWLK